VTDLTQLDAAVVWDPPPNTAQDRSAPAQAQAPASIQAQSQALALLQLQAPPRSVASTVPRPPSKGSSAEAGVTAKSKGGVAKQAREARQFQLVRRLYNGADEPSPLISVVG
jgi:hypothetical protein